MTVTKSVPCLLTLSLALVLAGCQSQSESPIAPGPGVVTGSTAGSAPTGSDSYSIESSGEFHFGLASDPSSPPTIPINAFRNVGKKSADVVLAPCCNSPNRLFFTGAFVAKFVNGATCFDSATAGDPNLVTGVGFAGALRLNKDGTVSAELDFGAPGTDDGESFLYSFRPTGVTGSTFPPRPGESSTITWGAGTMNTVGKGKEKKGGNAGKACTEPVTAPLVISATTTVHGCPGPFAGCS